LEQPISTLNIEPCASNVEAWKFNLICTFNLGPSFNLICAFNLELSTFSLEPPILNFQPWTLNMESWTFSLGWTLNLEPSSLQSWALNLEAFNLVLWTFKPWTITEEQARRGLSLWQCGNVANVYDNGLVLPYHARPPCVVFVAVQCLCIQYECIAVDYSGAALLSPTVSPVEGFTVCSCYLPRLICTRTVSR